MNFADDCLRRIDLLDERWRLPRVRALHLPPDPAPGEPRGEFCALELQDGSLGLSYVLLDDTLARLRCTDPNLGLAGAPAAQVARLLSGGDGARRALGLAAVNAISRWFFDRAGWQPEASVDSIGALDPRPGDHVGMIGLFTPLIARVLASGARLSVIELKPELAGQRDGYRITLDAQELRSCNKVLSTGALLLNDTLDPMLAQCRQAQWIAMVGPSVGCLPDGLFERGFTLLGGSWVLDAPGYVQALRAGVQRQGLSRKVSIERHAYPGFDTLAARLGPG